MTKLEELEAARAAARDAVIAAATPYADASAAERDTLEVASRTYMRCRDALQKLKEEN